MRHFWRRRPSWAVAALGITGAIALAGCNMAAQANDGPRPPEKVYSSTCGYCHGRNIGPILKGRGIPADTVRYMVRHGQGAMPAFRQTEITPQELDALAEWIEKSPADAKDHGQ